MDVARAKPKPRHEGRIPPAGGGCLLLGGQPEAATVPVDDVHQAQITWRRRIGDDVRRGQKDGSDVAADDEWNFGMVDH